MEIRFELGTLGIIEGPDKRALEVYVDKLYFRQRKNYDEYYIDVTSCMAFIDLKNLLVLAENFTVRILEDCVIISESK